MALEACGAIHVCDLKHDEQHAHTRSDHRGACSHPGDRCGASTPRGGVLRPLCEDSGRLHRLDESAVIELARDELPVLVGVVVEVDGRSIRAAPEQHVSLNGAPGLSAWESSGTSRSGHYRGAFPRDRTFGASVAPLV